MAACESLQHILDKSLPGSPKTSFFESLSPWSPRISINPVDNASFTELFGELHFQESNLVESNIPPSPPSPESPESSSLSSFSDSNTHQFIGIESLFGGNNEKTKTPFSSTCYYPSKKQYMHEDSFSSIRSSYEGLSHCTEGLGSESSDEVEEFGNDNISLDWRNRREEKQGANVVQERSEYMYCDRRRSRVNRGSFPPPISCIGGNGRPFVNFKAYRENGRFILKEVRIPQQEFLRASRENGRLRLELVHSDDEIFEEDDEEDFDLNNIKEVDEEIKEDGSFKEEEIKECNADDEEQVPINNHNKEH